MICILCIALSMLFPLYHTFFEPDIPMKAFIFEGMLVKVDCLLLLLSRRKKFRAVFNKFNTNTKLTINSLFTANHIHSYSSAILLICSNQPCVTLFSTLPGTPTSFCKIRNPIQHEVVRLFLAFGSVADGCCTFSIHNPICQRC